MSVRATAVAIVREFGMGDVPGVFGRPHRQSSLFVLFSSLLSVVPAFMFVSKRILPFLSLIDHNTNCHARKD